MNHFLLKNGSYDYKESEFTDEDFFLEEEIVGFFSRLGKVSGVASSDEAAKGRRKCLISVFMLIRSLSWKGRWASYCKFIIFIVINH